MKRENCLPAMGLCLLCAGLVLLIATSSSPLYATNFWTDTNIYFTIGRGMHHGLVPYRDLFDHKGPLLYLIYALGALISEKSFLGVFCLQVLSLCATLYLTYRTVQEMAGADAVLSIPLMAAASVITTAYNQGGSAEEFCLPALVLLLFLSVREMIRGESSGDVLFGAAAGWIFWIKYTVIGFAAGAGVCLLLARARRQGLRSMGRGIADMALGFLLISLLPVVYLWANHSLRLGMEVYFVQNLTGYSGEAMTLTGHLYNALAYLRTQGAINPGILVLAALGIVLCLVRAVICRTRGWLFQALLMPAGAGLLLLTVYWGEMAHPYYALVFAGLVPAGLGAVCILAEWLWHLSQKPTVLAALSLVLAIPIVPLAMHFCLSWPLAGVKAGDMPQTILAHEMEAEGGGTLLDLSGHDQGFYLASGTLPVCRYFADNNLNTEEKQAALMGYLESGKTEFVISRFRDPGQLYQPVMTVSGFFDLMDLREYTLYRRVEDGH